MYSVLRRQVSSRCLTRRPRRCPRRSRCCCKAGQGRAGMVCEHHPSPRPRPKSQAAGVLAAPAPAPVPAPAPAPFGCALRPLLHLARALRRLRHGLVGLAIRQRLLLRGVAGFAARQLLPPVAAALLARAVHPHALAASGAAATGRTSTRQRCPGCPRPPRPPRPAPAPDPVPRSKTYLHLIFIAAKRRDF